MADRPRRPHPYLAPHPYLELERADWFREGPLRGRLDPMAAGDSSNASLAKFRFQAGDAPARQSENLPPNLTRCPNRWSKLGVRKRSDCLTANLAMLTEDADCLVNRLVGARIGNRADELRQSRLQVE